MLSVITWQTKKYLCLAWWFVHEVMFLFMILHLWYFISEVPHSSWWLLLSLLFTSLAEWALWSSLMLSIDISGHDVWGFSSLPGYWFGTKAALVSFFLIDMCSSIPRRSCRIVHHGDQKGARRHEGNNLKMIR